jgi:predicted nuclease of predicted toxin-antitoxin system
VKVLLDENIPHKLRTHFPDHEVMTVAFLGWGGLKNGELLKAAEDASFDVFVTGDRALPFQQNMAGRKMAIVSLSAHNWPIIKHHVEKIAAAIDESGTGSYARVECGIFTRARNLPKGPTLD